MISCTCCLGTASSRVILPSPKLPSGTCNWAVKIRGEVSVSRLGRLASSLYSPKGELTVWLEFRLDERRIRTLRGTIGGELSLLCQRCLGGLRFPIELKFCLGIVSSEAEIDRLPEGYEPLLVSGEPISTIDVIEDEVLLTIPAIPLHDPAAETCKTGYENPSLPEAESPFAVLKNLKS